MTPPPDGVSCKEVKNLTPFRGQVSFCFLRTTAPLCKIQTPEPLRVSKKVEAKPVIEAFIHS